MAIAVRLMETEVSQQSGHTNCISLYVYRINEKIKSGVDMMKK